ncbi:MAG: DUF2061 domain-containing protein [Patescibacteria group bacterium]
MPFNEHISRSLVKSVTFRIIVLMSDFIVIYALTRKVDLSLELIVATNLASTTLYYLHERAWNKVTWGKAKA